MPFAARQFDVTNHPGAIATGSPTVLINGLPAARVLDVHACAFPPLAGPHPPNPIAQGSRTVLINGLGAARLMDPTGCGASIVSGSINVVIGG
jgi:uncharacterized Zn-binding protein involved in type VI secretion